MQTTEELVGELATGQGQTSTQILDGGIVQHTFTMGEILIAVLLLIIIVILLANMGNWGNKS